MNVSEFMQAVWAQDAGAIPGYFTGDAVIRWCCTNEQFTVEEFVRANCEYPGDWLGEIQRMEPIPGGCVTVSRVWPVDESLSFHVTSFFTMKDDKIAALDEYWADDGPAPQWRQDMHIGKNIREA